ncbi:MAG: N-acetylmuramoyl-L-alanine amidase [bacterium]|nr:N-acetylmuramoyl-L-alanine amidase [bacterium]
MTRSASWGRPPFGALVRTVAPRLRAMPVNVFLVVAAFLPLLVTALPVYAADSYLDPLAWTRIDARAPVVNLVVEQRGTRQTQTVGARRLLEGSREIYVRSADFATAMRAGRFWQDTLRRLDLDVGGKVFTVTGGSRVVMGSPGESLLPVPVLDHAGDLWLPLDALLRVVGPATGLEVAFDAGSGRVTLGPSDDNVENVTIETLGHSTAVHLRCRDPLGWSVERPAFDQVTVSLRGGRADAAALSATPAAGFVRAVEARQDADRLVVTLRLGDGAGEHRAYAADGGRDVVVVLAAAATADQAADSSGAAPADDPVAALLPPAPGADAAARPLRTVVIDPGHGGGDTGAVGRRGIMEKDVNLAVARELKQYLERSGGLDVVLTRQRDEAMDLDARAEAANAAGGDLFISLHCNSWFDDQARGFETYFLSPASSDWARSVEAAENGASDGGREPGDVEFIVWELVQNRYITRSSQFAEYLQARACRELGSPDRGVRQAGFRVLVGAYMPAVLVELGFLSHADEEMRLDERTYQRQLARTIGDAVLGFARTAATAGAGTEASR